MKKKGVTFKRLADGLVKVNDFIGYPHEMPEAYMARLTPHQYDGLWSHNRKHWNLLRAQGVITNNLRAVVEGKR